MCAHDGVDLIGEGRISARWCMTSSTRASRTSCKGRHDDTATHAGVLPLRRSALRPPLPQTQCRRLPLQHVPALDGGPFLGSIAQTVRRLQTASHVRDADLRRSASRCSTTARSYDDMRLAQDFTQLRLPLAIDEGMTGPKCCRLRRRELIRRSRLTHERLPRCAISPSISGRSIRRRTACCVSCWSWTARWSSASIRTSGCCIAAPRS